MKHVPNILTLSRILLIPALIGAFYLPFPWSNWVAFALFVLAGVTDVLDGVLARTYEVTSLLGRCMDPIADKLVVATVLLMLTAFDVIAGIHVVAALIILFREIFVSGLREFLSTLKTYVPVTRLAKMKTAFQVVALSALLIGEAAPAWLPALLIGKGLLWAAAILTLYTGYDYFRAGLKHL